MRYLLLLLISTTLQACIPSKIKGQIKDSQETFIGKVSGDLKNGGSLRIESSKGVVCEGDFEYAVYKKALGFFHCTDGRSGPV